jgi:hypothetical protein
MVAVIHDGAKSLVRATDRQSLPVRSGRGRLIVRLLALLAAVAALCPAPAAAQRARIQNLSDVNFGTLTNLTVDASRNQDICVFSQINGYNVRASGDGTGGAFTLNSGGNALAYEVQWNSSAGQTSGTMLTANTTLSGLTSTANNQGCNQGLTASLIVVLRSGALSSATAGTYSGTLTLVVAPE